MTVLLLSLLIFGAAFAGAAERVSDKQAIQILDRLGFGPTAADVAHVKAVGIGGYIAEQLDPGSIAGGPGTDWSGSTRSAR